MTIYDFLFRLPWRNQKGLELNRFVSFVLALYGGRRDNVTSRWRNLTGGQATVMSNYVLVTSHSLYSLNRAAKRMGLTWLWSMWCYHPCLLKWSRELAPRTRSLKLNMADTQACTTIFRKKHTPKLNKKKPQPIEKQVKNCSLPRLRCGFSSNTPGNRPSEFLPLNVSKRFETYKTHQNNWASSNSLITTRQNNKKIGKYWINLAN